MKYLFIKEGGELEQGNEISDDKRENVDDGVLSIIRLNNRTGSFKSLEVEREEDDDGEEVWGEDQWNAV